VCGWGRGGNTLSVCHKLVGAQTVPHALKLVVVKMDQMLNGRRSRARSISMPDTFVVGGERKGLGTPE
jgi:hypothetical protein